jgi:hypothetical protein
MHIVPSVQPSATPEVGADGRVGGPMMQERRPAAMRSAVSRTRCSGSSGAVLNRRQEAGKGQFRKTSSGDPGWGNTPNQSRLGDGQAPMDGQSCQ